MKYKNPNIGSSYRENDLGKTLYDLVLKEKPKKIIEFGTLNGYSAVAMAMALDELGEGHITTYDLWGAYAYQKGNRSFVEESIAELGLEKYVTIESGDFNSWIPEPCDLFHLDISNDGEKLKKLAEKTKGIGTVIFEGGSKERDNISWMSKYNKQPMQSCGVRYDILNEKFPSISRLI